MIRIEGERLIADLRQLAGFGKCGTGVDRLALSPTDKEARQWLGERLADGGLDARIDRYGNVLGSYPGVARAVLVGSHTDTVPRGGWLDGALGVIYGLEIARALRESGGAPRVGVDVISFQDEEGTYLPFLGSLSFCGELADQDIAAAKSKEGTSLRAVLGPWADGEAPLRRDPARHLAYLEAHIEQGPRLEAAGRRIGVVSGIVGIRRLRLLARGQPDHAGTTPMAMRRDAGAALVALASRVAAEFPTLGGPETVWNIGAFTLRPGAANVVPGEAEMTLEFRDIVPEVLDRLEAAVHDWVAEENRLAVVEVAATLTALVPPTAMAADLAALIAAAARAAGEEPLTMPSGAGHDATVLGRFMPAAMLFVPSIGGRSHDISEDTAEADIILGCQVLADAVTRFAQGQP